MDMRKAVFRLPKGRKSQAKRPSFGVQKTAFCNALNIKPLKKEAKTAFYVNIFLTLHRLQAKLIRQSNNFPSNGILDANDRLGMNYKKHKIHKT